MDCDHDIFLSWLVELSPEYVYIGLNSHPESVTLPEPDADKVSRFVEAIDATRIPMKAKFLPGHEGITP